MVRFFALLIMSMALGFFACLQFVPIQPGQEPVERTGNRAVFWMLSSACIIVGGY